MRIYINGELADFKDLNFRLTKNLQGFFGENLKNFGGTFSTNIEFIASPTNRRIFERSNIKSIGKYKRFSFYNCRLVKDGTTITEGTFELESMSNENINGIFISNDIDWTSKLGNKKLNEVGYVDGVATWTYDFSGRYSFNTLNSGSSRNYPILCPTIQYYNTPLTDYKDFTSNQIWGEYNGNTEITPSLEFPNEFECRSGYFSGERLGLTFQDFPPAVYYKSVIQKIFEGIGLSVYSPLFDTDGFDRLYLPYVGKGYQYNWKKLASMSTRLDLTFENGPTEFSLYEDLPNLELTNFSIPISGLYRPIKNDTARFKFFLCTRYPTEGSYVDYTHNYQPINNDRQFVIPVDSQYKLRIKNNYTSSAIGFVDLITGGETIYSGVDLYESYATQDVNSPKANPMIDRAYGWDDNVLLILRKNESNEFDFNDTFEYLKRWMSGEDKDFINNPSDVIAYLSPKRYQLYLDGTITDIKEAIGSPLTNWENEVTVNLHSHTVVADTAGVKASNSVGELEITVDLKTNERVEVYWVSLGNIQGDVSYDQITVGNVARQAATNTTHNGNANLSGATSLFSIENLCGDDLLDIAKNLPNISQKEFVQTFMKMYNQSFVVKDNTIFFIPIKDFYDIDTYDITKRVDSSFWSSRPLDIPKTINIGYDNDNKDRLINVNRIGCSTDTIEMGNYANTSIDLSDNIYANGEKNNINYFSSTLFTQGNFDNLKRPTTDTDCLTSIHLDKTTPKYITGGTDSNYNIEVTGATTVSAWFKMDSFTTTLPSIIVSKYDLAALRGWFVDVEANGAIAFSIQDTGAANSLRFYSDETVELDQWNNVIVTYNGSASLSGMTMYINGVEATPSPINSVDNLTTASTVTSNFGMVIGNVNNTPTINLGFDGYIYSVTKWDFNFNAQTADLEYQGGFNGFRVFPLDRQFDFVACDGVWDSPLQLFGAYDWIDRFDSLLTYRSVDIFEANLEESSPIDSGLVVYTTSPQTGTEAVKYYDVRNTVDTTFPIPNIQSEVSFNQLKFDDFTYDYAYAPRVLYHLGTTNQYFNVNGGIIVDNPNEDKIINLDESYWILPTVSAFSTENNNPYQSLRYDTNDGLYYTYFENLQEFYFDNEEIKLKVLLRPSDFNAISRSKKVTYDGQTFKVLSISDYDVEGINQCTITLIRDM